MSKAHNFAYQRLSLKSIQSDIYADYTYYLHLKKVTYRLEHPYFCFELVDLCLSILNKSIYTIKLIHN